MEKKRIIYVILFLFLFSFLFSASQSDKKSTDLTLKAKKQAIQQIIYLLRDNYVFPKQALKIGNHLKTQLKKKTFKSITDPQTFAREVTREIWSIFEDRHLRFRVRRPRPPERKKPDPLIDGYFRDREMIEENFGFKKVEVLEGNVGYLDFRYFGPPERCKNVLSKAMAFIENTDAVIIDMRKNGGGSPGMVQLVCSYFFDKKVHLNSLYWRRGNRTEEFWTLDDIDGKKRPDVPVFILTAKRTFSGAEEFSYNMLTQKRATLVGEVTGGGANPGGGRMVGNQFTLFIPTGRAINPVTKTNWEGTGVTPDVPVTAEDAYHKGYEMAKKAAEKFREKRIGQVTEDLNKIRGDLTKAAALIGEKKIQEAEEVVFCALDRGRKRNLFNEMKINDLGYNYLGKKELRMAIAFFTYNVKVYPGSWNAFDSLGEAWKKIGNLDLAIKNYQKSVELNPDHQVGRAILKELQVKKSKKKNP